MAKEILRKKQIEDAENIKRLLDKHEEKEQELNFLELLRENRRLKDAKICIVCFDQPRSRLFLPCAHLGCCKFCAPCFTHCPQCKKRIRANVTVHFA